MAGGKATSGAGKLLRWFIVLLAAGGAVTAAYWTKWRIVPGAHANSHAAQHAPREKEKARLADQRDDTVLLPADVVRDLRVKSKAVGPALPAGPLRLTGSLMLDPSHLARVRARFDGQVVKLGPVDPNDPESRPLQFGDSVHKGQLLAVIWSKEIGQKKSDLLDALSRLKLAKITLTRLKSLRTGDVAERVVREAEREYEGNLIAVQTAERTLRSWRLTDEEVDGIRQEAERIHEGQTERDRKLDTRWAELDVLSPIDGVVLEKNITVGEIVDSSLDLFKVGDVRKLLVVAHVYEEDLPLLEQLPAAQRRWKLKLLAQPDSPSIERPFELTGRIIDPAQHTAQAMGRLDNPDGKLLVGQFITASVELPARVDEVSVPASALVEDGETSVVFVVGGAGGNEFTRTPVAVSRRGRDVVHLRTHLTKQEQDQGLRSLTPGEQVVTSGAVVLASTWQGLQRTDHASSRVDIQQGGREPRRKDVRRMSSRCRFFPKAWYTS